MTQLINSPEGGKGVKAQLGANVTMSNSLVWYDGPTISLTPGNWFISGTLTILNPGAANNLMIALRDGTNKVVVAGLAGNLGNEEYSAAVSYQVSPTVLTTYKLSAYSLNLGGRDHRSKQ